MSVQGGWEGSGGAEERKQRERGREKGKERKPKAAACEFGIRLEEIVHSGEMDSVPRLTSVLTLVLSGLWNLGLTATNCEYSELGAR